ncbi:MULTISPECIES: hypothetical protein [unclassified Mycolicibacterium]|uniref:hypothetical protein n=1 Tax=unclassified Mycolicibacterium TaxID=2636767 RepID=UPI002ED8B9CA
MNAPFGRREALLRDFQEALLTPSGNAELDKITRENLLMSTRGDGTLISEWHRLVGAEQAVLDLHLTGAGTVGNATRADKFSSFVSNIGNTVQLAARGATGRARYPHNLLVEGAQPGSVRVVLRAPIPKLPKNQQVDDLTLASSVDSDALRLIATIIAHANDVAQDSVLTGAIQALPDEARVPLRKAMTAVQTAGWELRGNISQRGFGYNELALSTQGAARLRAELDAETVTTFTQEMFGRISGSKDIEGLLWFDPEGGREFRAVVEDPDLRRKVVQLQLDHPRVFAKFDVVESRTEGGEEISLRTSRTLRSVSLAPLGEQGAFDEGDMPTT